MLRLTKKADYSLIALKHFASRQRETGEAVSAKEVADTCGIPLPVLSKLLQKLGKAGFLVSAYGTNGGYRLARDPRFISALEVIRAIDGPIVLANCFTDSAYCDHAARCTVRRPLKRIHEAILRLLDSVSIEDMLQDSEDQPRAFLASPLVALQNTPKSLEAQSFLRK
ncbi:MAG: Rrf2 family transcriptional regulator [Bryobacteraceae bacterium]